MESNHWRFSVTESVRRIDDILSTGSGAFEAKDSIPNRDQLTYKNGFYVRASALFVDIRGSSRLSEKYYRPKLAKLYRSYISEVVAVLNGYLACKEINIVGDSVSAVFDGRTKDQINDVFSAACAINSLVNVLNCKYAKHDISSIEVGIGVDWGRVLMIQAGYSGSGINDVVWMGPTVNRAAHLCEAAGRNQGKPIRLTSAVHGYLNENNQSLCFQRPYPNDEYESDAVRQDINEWYKENCR